VQAVSNLNLPCVDRRLSAALASKPNRYVKDLNFSLLEAAGAAMEGELDLLLSVAGGLGRWLYVDDLKRVYVKDDDCLGETMFAGACTSRHGHQLLQ
jgi:hypothetical protein